MVKEWKPLQDLDQGTRIKVNTNKGTTMHFMFFEPINPLPKLEGRDLEVVSAVGAKSSLRGVSATLKLSLTAALHRVKEMEKKQLIRCVRSWN